MICIVEMLGPCRFSHWADEQDAIDYGVAVGDPVGRENPVAWIQVAAVSQDQTRNTMTLLPSMISPQLMKLHGMNKLDIGKEKIFAHRGARRIEAVTSNPRTLEGGRPTFVVRNETHHWVKSNDGHAMAGVIERNAVKSAGGQARALSITNAYEPSEDSVAQRQREAWESEQNGESINTGMLYDSLEAPESVTMLPPEAHKDKEDWAKNPPTTPEESKRREKMTIAWLSAIVRAVRGDSVWLDIPSIVMAILRRTTPQHEARRFWFNNIVAAADAWADPAAVTAAIDPLLRVLRATQREGDQLRLGWIVDPTDQIVMFFDGSKSDDSTVLVGCRLEDGYVFTIGVWSKPAGKAGEEWLAPREDVNARVDEAFERFNVVGFWGDPSHTLEDDSTRYWDSIIDSWHRKYKDRLQAWAVKSGTKTSSVMWDMTSRERQAEFVAAAESTRTELHHRDHTGAYAPQFTIDGHPALIAHLRNARENRLPEGVSVRKNNRESGKKIDLAVGLIGARLLRRVLLNIGVEEEQEVGGWVTAF